jgi:hypothetical protein
LFDNFAQCVVVLWSLLHVRAFPIRCFILGKVMGCSGLCSWFKSQRRKLGLKKLVDEDGDQLTPHSIAAVLHFGRECNLLEYFDSCHFHWNQDKCEAAMGVLVIQVTWSCMHVFCICQFVQLVFAAGPEMPACFYEACGAHRPTSRLWIVRTTPWSCHTAVFTSCSMQSGSSSQVCGGGGGSGDCC